MDMSVRQLNEATNVPSLDTGFLETDRPAIAIYICGEKTMPGMSTSTSSTIGSAIGEAFISRIWQATEQKRRKAMASTASASPWPMRMGGN